MYDTRYVRCARSLLAASPGYRRHYLCAWEECGDDAAPITNSCREIISRVRLSRSTRLLSFSIIDKMINNRFANSIDSNISLFFWTKRPRLNYRSGFLNCANHFHFSISVCILFVKWSIDKKKNVILGKRWNVFQIKPALKSHLFYLKIIALIRFNT